MQTIIENSKTYSREIGMALLTSTMIGLVPASLFFSFGVAFGAPISVLLALVILSAGILTRVLCYGEGADIQDLDQLTKTVHHAIGAYTFIFTSAIGVFSAIYFS